MYKAYGCEKAGYRKLDPKSIQFASKILKKRSIGIMINIAMIALGTLFAGVDMGTSIFLEFIQLTDMSASSLKTYVRLFRSLARVGNSLAMNYVEYTTRLNQLNPNSTLFLELLNLKFDGDFEKFEKDCDVIFNKETYAYAADDYVILYCIITDAIYELMKEKLTPDFLIPNSMGGLFGMKKYDETRGIHDFVKERDISGPKFVVETGGGPEYVSTGKAKGFVPDWEKFGELPPEVSRVLAKDLERLQDPKVMVELGEKYAKIFTNMISELDRSILGIDEAYFTKDYIKGVLKRTDFIKNMNNDAAEDALIDEVLPLVPRYGRGRGPIPGESRFWPRNEREYQDKFIALRDKFVKKNVEAYKSNMLSFTSMTDRMHDLIQEENRKNASRYKAQQAELLKVGGFLTIKYFYAGIKLLIKSVPRGLMNILTSASRNSGLIDEFLALVAGVVLGKDYLHVAQSSEVDSKVDILNAYISGAIKDPNPFINNIVTDRYLIDQIPEKFKKEQAANIFITDEDYRKLEKERIQKEVVRKLVAFKGEGSGKMVGGDGGDDLQAKKDILREIRQESENLPTIAKIEAIPSQTNTNVIAKVAGLYVNKASGMKLPKGAKDLMYKMMCSLSARGDIIGHKFVEFFIMSMALSYIANRLTDISFIQFKEYSRKKREVGQVVESFSDYCRYLMR